MKISDRLKEFSLCVDCKWCKKIGLFGLYGCINKQVLLESDKVGQFLVGNNPSLHVWCVDQRRYSAVGCTKEGIYWEAKE